MPAQEDVNGQPQSPFMRPIFGLPVVVWVVIVAVVAYLLIRRSSVFGGGAASSGAGISTSGGGGSATSGSTTIDKGAVQITVSQGSQKQPHPPVRKRQALVAVKDVRGRSYDAASAALRRQGLATQRSSPYVGKVTRESPHSGTKVPKGTMITLSGANKGNTNPWPGQENGEG